MDPKNPDGHYNKGVLLYEFEEYESSTKYFSKAIELGIDDMNSAYYMKGLSLMLSEKYSESIKYFNMCSNKENDPHLLLDFGIALQKNGDSVKSTEYLVKSLLLFSRSHFHHTYKEYYLGLVLQGLGVHDMAMHYFKNMLDAEPNDSEPNLAMGESLLETKQYADAASYFDKVLQVEPKINGHKERRTCP